MKANVKTGTLDDIEFPEIIYKYRDWKSLYNRRFIINREVYMASPNQFEDEIDCKIPVRHDLMTENQAKIYYEHLSKIAEPNLTREQRKQQVKFHLKKKDYLSIDKLHKHQKFYFEQYFKRLGILSLTAENCLDEMWKKYSNKHTGFCIGYNSRILFEHLGGGAKVEYFDNLPILLPDPIMDREIIRYKQIYFKERKWEFEKEYRTQKFWYNGATSVDRNIVIPKEAFNCVILGKNMNDTDKREILKEIKENIGNIKIIEYKNVCQQSV